MKVSFLQIARLVAITITLMIALVFVIKSCTPTKSEPIAIQSEAIEIIK